MFQAMLKGFSAVRVLNREGKPIKSIRELLEAACRRGGIEEFTFLDLRQTAIHNWRLQGHDYFRIMAASGHKTMQVFKRYNRVSETELKILVQGKI
jgi:integrase